jgi:hypothetical protein
MPVLPTVAMPPALVLQTPPGVASVNAVVKPTQTCGLPRIFAGDAFTVIVFVTVQPLPNE